MSLKDNITYEYQSGEPLTVNGTTLTPQSRAFSLRWPNGGLVWNRPVAVLVEREGQVERLPIADVTRYAQIALYGSALFFALMALVASLGRRRKRK
jgi:hypothetical protein